MILCNSCKNIGACVLCLDHDFEEKDKDIPFDCPSCFKQEKGDVPYVSNFLYKSLRNSLKTY